MHFSLSANGLVISTILEMKIRNGESPVVKHGPRYYGQQVLPRFFSPRSNSWFENEFILSKTKNKIMETVTKNPAVEVLQNAKTQTTSLQQELDILLKKFSKQTIVLSKDFSIEGTVCCHNVGPRPAKIKCIELVLPGENILWGKKIFNEPRIRITIDWKPISQAERPFEERMLEAETIHGISIPKHRANSFFIQDKAGVMFPSSSGSTIWEFQVSKDDFVILMEFFKKLKEIDPCIPL